MTTMLLSARYMPLFLILTTTVLLLLSLLGSTAHVSAFAPSNLARSPASSFASSTSSSSLSTSSWSALAIFGIGGSNKASSSVKPTLDKTTNKYIKAVGDDGVYPYDAVGSLIRHGPAPFLKRLTDPSGYEQDVLAYMAATGCSRAEATDNMDAKTNNAADWTYQKMEEKKSGKSTIDYTVLDAKQAALTVVWALGITPLVVYSIVQTFSQFGTGPSTIQY